LSIRQKTISAVRWTSIAAVIRAVIQIAQVSILARLLAPQDYGLMAIVSVILSFTALFSDFGMNSAYVQRHDVSEEQRSSLFWLNILISSGLFLVLLILSPFIGWIYSDGRLVPLMMLSGTTFVFNALGQQVRMSAEKNLVFRPVVLIEISSTLLGFIAAVYAAMHGLRVYSLVISGIVSAFVASASAWIFIANGWRPMLRMHFKDIIGFIGFGSTFVSNNLVNQLNSTIDIFLGGKLLSQSDLGLYSVPRNLTLQVQNLVNPIITRVGFPLIAKVHQDAELVKSVYLKTINMTASTNAPLYICICFFAPEIVMIVLGPDWGESTELLRILALWGALRSTGNPVGSLLMGMGRADTALKWNIGLLLIVSAGLWTGSHWGVIGIAWTLLVIQMVIFVPSWYILVSPLCNLKLKQYSITALRPFILAFISILPSFLIATKIEIELGRIFIGFIISALLYLSISHRFNREWTVSMLELFQFKK